MSLRARLALLFGLLTAAGITVVAVLVFRSADNELAAETDVFLQNRANEVAGGLREPPRDGRGRGQGDRPERGQDQDQDPQTEQVTDALNAQLSFDPDAIVQTLDPDGNVLASSSFRSIPVSEADIEIAGTNTKRDAEQGEAKADDLFQDVDIDGEQHRVYTLALPAGGAVQVARSVEETGRVLDSLGNQVLAIGLAMSAGAALLGFVVARQTTKPLRRLATTASHVAATQDLDTRIDVDRSDEVGQLARSFQEMLDALATSREQQHRLVLDAGHELRTPLTSLRANVALLERAEGMDPEDRAQVLASVKAELGELNELFGELIDLATDTADADPFVRLDLVDVVESAVARLHRRTDREIRVHADSSVVMGDPSLLERAVSNLLGNAHKFSPPRTPVEVVVHEGRVAVRDQGPGIPPEDRARVFDRFFRSDATRTMPGSGLGLAIVHQVVRNHGGHVWAADSPSTDGAEVGFAIPLINEDA